MLEWSQIIDKYFNEPAQTWTLKTLSKAKEFLNDRRKQLSVSAQRHIIQNQAMINLFPSLCHFICVSESKDIESLRDFSFEQLVDNALHVVDDLIEKSKQASEKSSV